MSQHQLLAWAEAAHALLQQLAQLVRLSARLPREPFRERALTSVHCMRASEAVSRGHLGNAGDVAEKTSEVGDCEHITSH